MKSSTTQMHDAVVIGAGFAGMYQLIRLRELGLDTVVLERGPEVGGTWYWNRYPGARCDITSLDYSYSFDESLQQEWEWSEKFATQPEILSYAKHVADRFDLRRDIRFENTVTGAEWHAESARWEVTASERGGATVQYSARYIIFATGNLSAVHAPNIEGLSSFEGRMFHSAEWPETKVDFTGRRVGIIGTGSSGIQIAPLVAEQAGSLTVFHRTPNFSLPANNRPLTEAEVVERKADYAAYREAAKHSFTGVPVPVATQSVFEVTDEERERVFEEAWNSGRYGALLASYTDLSIDARANELVSDFIRRKVRGVVDDPQRAEVLEPRGNYFGTKRSCLDTNYYQMFNRENVELVDLFDSPIVRVEEHGVRTQGGFVELDDLVLATGFDAMTGSILAVDPVGEGGKRLSTSWEEGPYTYLGVASRGFPNLFFITGPGSPSVLSNMIVSIEQHVEWVTALIAEAQQREADRVEIVEGAQEAWMQNVHDEAAKTLYLSGNSWYLGANIPGKPRVFMPYVAGVGTYREIADAEAAAGYPQFVMQ